MGVIEVLNPVADTRSPELPLAKRFSELRGKALGFLNNRKANAGLLLEHVERLLHERCGDFSVIKGEKNAALGAPEKVMNKLFLCDAVITAVGD
jgi:hypothetical protein